ncbi:uncharacterized protein NPIL_498351 [Nephila pilipes]|uniref:Uncharacterized protein n=1 Tax=Nephila pilipes TaxID=299642 RepID=A0A8X6IGB3_NEPPI|nr:uncharacterized protein NPIL_498351 [Nephila pilipes]
MDACGAGSDVVNRYLPRNYKYKILKKRKIDYQNFDCDLRVALNNSDDFREWLELFKANSNTDWILRQSKTSEDTVLNQYYVCQRSSYGKKRKYEDDEDYSESDFKCKAFISVKILKGGKPVCYRDPFIKYGYRAVIQIYFIHCHLINSLETMRQSEETKMAFIGYFTQGMSPSEAIRNHEEILLLEAHEYLGGSRNNPPENWVYSLYNEWVELTRNRMEVESHLARSSAFWKLREKSTQPQDYTSSKKNIVKLSKTKEVLGEMEISTDPEISEEDNESDTENLYDSYDEGSSTRVSQNHGSYEEGGKYSTSAVPMKLNVANRVDHSRNHNFHVVKKSNKGHNQSFANIVPLQATVGNNTDKNKSSTLETINKQIISIPTMNAVKSVRIGEGKILRIVKNDCEVQKLPVVKPLPLPLIIRKGRDASKSNVQIGENANVCDKSNIHVVKNSTVDFKKFEELEEFSKNIDSHRRSNLHLIRSNFRDIKKSKKYDEISKNIETIRRSNICVVKGNSLDVKKSRKSEDIQTGIDASKINNVYVMKGTCDDCKELKKPRMNVDNVKKISTNDESNCEKCSNSSVSSKSLYLLVKKVPCGESASGEVKQSDFKLTSFLEFLRRLRKFQGRNDRIFGENIVPSSFQHNHSRSDIENKNTKLISKKFDKSIQTLPSVDPISICAASNLEKVGYLNSKIDQSTQTFEDKCGSINQQSSLQSLNSDLQNCSLSHNEKPSTSVEQNQTKQNSGQNNKHKVVITIHNKEQLKNYLLNSGKSSVITADQGILHSDKLEKMDDQSNGITLSTLISSDANQDSNLRIPKKQDPTEILSQSKTPSNNFDLSTPEKSGKFVNKSNQAEILPSSGNLFSYIDSVYAQQRLKLQQCKKVNDLSTTTEKNVIHTSESQDSEDIEIVNSQFSQNHCNSLNNEFNNFEDCQQYSIAACDSVDQLNSKENFDKLNNDSDLNSLQMFGNLSDDGSSISSIQSSRTIDKTNVWQHVFSNFSESKNENDNFDLDTLEIPQIPRLTNLCENLNGEGDESPAVNGSTNCLPLYLNLQDNIDDNVIEIPENLLDNLEDLSLLQHFLGFGESDLIGEFESHCQNEVLEKWDLEMQRLRNMLALNIHDEDIVDRANKFLEKIRECIKQPTDLSTFFASSCNINK